MTAEYFGACQEIPLGTPPPNHGAIPGECHTLRVLGAVQPVPLDGETVEARFISPRNDRPTVRRFYGSQAELLTDAARFAPGHHCYYGVALRLGRDGTAAGLSRAGACWADIDAKLWAGAIDPKAAALAAIEAFPLQPGVLVDSWGGYQPYWLLAEPLDLREEDNRARLELVNAGLARAVCGPERTPDHVHDAPRVLRLPGTSNLKPEYGAPRPVTVVRCEPRRRYALDELRSLLMARYPWALRPPVPARACRPTVRPIPSDAPPGGLRELATRGRIRRSTLALLDCTGAAGYRSASEADAAIAAALIGAGLTEAEALALIVCSARGVDATVRKGPRYAEAYWQRTVAHAADYVGPVLERSGGLRVRTLAPPRRLRGLLLAAPTRREVAV